MPRVAVLVPCHGEGELLAQAVDSIDEREPVEIVVVDDASPDAATAQVLERLERRADVRVLRRERNGGVGVARTTAFDASSAPYVFPLDADDLAIGGVLARMADALDADPGAAACVGDVEEFGDRRAVRRTPHRLDPYRVALTNEFPITALFRRDVVQRAGAWLPFYEHPGYEDWHLWMSLAERRERIVPLGSPAYRRRLHGERLNQSARSRHAERYAALRQAHPDLFAHLGHHRAATDLPWLKRVLYPLVYGARAEVPLERTIKPWFDRLGIWTRAAR